MSTLDFLGMIFSPAIVIGAFALGLVALNHWRERRQQRGAQ